MARHVLEERVTYAKIITEARDLGVNGDLARTHLSDGILGAIIGRLSASLRSSVGMTRKKRNKVVRDRVIKVLNRQSQMVGIDDRETLRPKPKKKRKIKSRAKGRRRHRQLVCTS